MLKYEIKEKSNIAIIGKEGLCTPKNNIAQSLWEDSTRNFEDVRNMGKKKEDGTFVGFWGAMSDEEMKFLPWTNNFSRGLYLAGIEVEEDEIAPEGWTKWVLPARKYLIVEVTMDKYGEIFHEVIEKVIPENNLRLSGAVCDYVEPSTGKNKLYFPVEEK